MSKRKRVCDVFIANSPDHAPLATGIAETCRASGLEAITNEELRPGADTSDALWEALAESRALIVIPPASGPTDSMWIEIGAVSAWNKPILGVLTDPSMRLPQSLSGIPWFVPSRIDELINAIKSMDHPFSEGDAKILADVYDQIGESVDRLTLEPRLRQQLVRRFTARAHRAVTEELLLSELLRMRKRGLLKGGARSRARPPVGST